MKFYRLDKTICGGGIIYKEYSLIKETDKGYWIDYGDASEDRIRQALTSKQPWKEFGFIWIAKKGRKRYAYPTKEEAKESFIARREKYIRILECRLKQSRMLLKKAKADDFTFYPSLSMESFFDD